MNDDSATWNNQILKYLNSNFDNYPGRLGYLLFFRKLPSNHSLIVLNQKNDSSDRKQFDFKIIEISQLSYFYFII